MEINDIKARLPILTVLQHYGLTPNRNPPVGGQGFRVLCPWHDDRTPSLQIYPETNTWTCFSSACSAGSGDVIEMIQNMEKCTKREAILTAKHLIDPVSYPLSQNGVSLSHTAILTKYYQATIHAMQRSKKGRAYATSRCLDWQKLGIGYAGYHIGDKWNDDPPGVGQALRTNAEKLGLFKIKNCIIFPTKNSDGQIVHIYGRSVSPKTESKHFYLSGAFKGLYPRWPKADTTHLILCESIIDAASLVQYFCTTHVNYEVLALYGSNGFTAAHETAIKNLDDLQEIIFFFDGDKAGNDAVKKYTRQLQKLVPNVALSTVTTPEGEDPNSLVQNHPPVGGQGAPEVLQHLINERTILFSIEKNKITNAKRSASGTLHTDNADILIYQTNTLTISILGGIKITGLDRLRVTLKVEKSEHTHFLPVRFALDLYHARSVDQLTQKIAESLDIPSSNADEIISHLTTALEQYRQRQLELLKPKKDDTPSMTDEEKSAALAYLKDKDLLQNTLLDIARSGVVGEEQNALIAYLAYTSRKREKPLHIMCLGSSGSGKTYLQEKVSALIPDEDKREITSLSDNALYYFGRYELQNKLMLIEDLDGAQNAEYPLREIQSKRRLSKTVAVKNNKGGKPNTINVTVEGPVCVSGCTTREKLYEDNANRCILLYIDESAEQDRRVMTYQQAMSSGAIDQAQEGAVQVLLQHVQRCLQPIHVVNPYASLIDLPPEVFKPRRTLLLLLSFIETITFYHQYQREVKVFSSSGLRYIESTKEDVEAAFELMKDVLFSKSDELSKACRNFLETLKTLVKDGDIFYAKQIRNQLRMAPATLKRYLVELVRYDYVKIKGGSKYRGFEYEISDYQECKALRGRIDQRIKDIQQKIEQKTTPSDQKEWLSGSSVAHLQNEPLNAVSTNHL